MRKDLPRGRASGAAGAGQLADERAKRARERPSLALVDARALATPGCEGSHSVWPAWSAATRTVQGWPSLRTTSARARPSSGQKWGASSE